MQTSEANRRVDIKVWGSPGESRVEVYLCETAYDAIYRHGTDYTSREVGGLLLGSVFTLPDGRYRVDVVAAIRAAGAPGNHVRMQFTAEAWRQLIESAQRDYPSYKVVGWYHTHPNLGTFMSGDDIHAHDIAFSHPWHIAAVCDPVRNGFSFFGRDGDEIKLIRGFYTYGPAAGARESPPAADPPPAIAGDRQSGFMIMLLFLLAIASIAAVIEGIFLFNQKSENDLAPGTYLSTAYVDASNYNHVYMIDAGRSRLWNIKYLNSTEYIVVSQADFPYSFTAINRPPAVEKLGGGMVLRMYGRVEGRDISPSAPIDADGNIGRWSEQAAGK